MSELPREISEDPRFRRVEDERARDAARAREAQALYVRATRVLVFATAAAAIVGGLVLYGLEARPAPERVVASFLADPTVRAVLVSIEGACVAASAWCGYLLGARDPRRVWVEARLRAEEGRLLRAARALEIGREKGAETFRLAGEWFEGFMLDQLSHLDAAARRRERAAQSIAALGATLAALGALATALSNANVSLAVVAVAIFGVAAPAVVAAVRGWGEATAGARRAELHARSWSALNALQDALPAFRAAVASGDLDAAMGFARRVFAVLREDHAGFASAHGEGAGAG